MNKFQQILDVIQVERKKKDEGIHLPLPITGVSIQLEYNFEPLNELLRLHNWNKSEVGRLLGVSDVTVNNWLEGYRRMNWVNKQKIVDVLADQKAVKE